MTRSPGLSRAYGLLRLFRLVSLRLGDQIIGQPRIGIESDDAFGVGDKVRQRVDVVIEQPSVAIVNYVLDSANLDARVFHDALHILNHLARRSIAFHLQAVFRSVHRTYCSRQFFTLCALADVSGTQIEGFAGGVNLNRIEELAAEHFDASDDTATGWEKFLHQCDLIDSEVELAFVYGSLQLLGPVEANDPGAAAANIRLYHQWVADFFRGRQSLRRMINHQRLRIRQSQRFEKGELQRLGSFVRERA